jgi:hypothetical protein
VAFDKRKSEETAAAGKSILHITITLKHLHGAVQRAAAMKK